MKIPAITADPIAMFFEERKEEAELHEKQKEAVKKAWETLIHQEGFTGFQFKDHRGWTIYFHPSSREGIDWQLSYQGADGEFFSHADFLERTDDPKKGWNMRELYRELLPCSQRGREVEVTVLIDEREIEKGIENMAEKRNLTEIEAKSVAMHYAIGIDDAEKSIWQNITDYEPKEQETPTINASAFPKVAVLQTNGERSFQRYDENTTYSSKDYELVYWTPDVATLTHREDMQIRLNRIYQEMQWTMQPHDYYGHTLSTGDVLVLMENQDTYQSYLVDTVGFQKLPDSFLTQDMIHKIQYDLDIKQEYLMYQNLESLSAEKEEIKQLLSERTAQLKEYEPIFDLAEKRGIILTEQDKIETVYQYENKTQPENRLTLQEKVNNEAVLSMDVDREAERAIDQAEVRAMGGELPIRGKEVAIESTEDYADQTFHQDTVDMAVENEDGTYGKTVHFYRIVEIGEDDRLHPLDDNQFTSYEEAKWMIEQNPDYDLISYDEMVHEVVQRMEINGDEKEDMISEKEPTIEGKKRIAAYIYEHNDGDQIWEDTTEFYADEHGNYVKQNADGWTQKKKIVSITYDEIIKDMEKVQSEVEEQRRIRENGGDYRGGYQITFNELENNSKEQSQNKSEIISEKLTAEDVKVLQGISISKQSSRVTIYQFECEIKGEKDRLTYELSQHDDSEGFTIHTEKNDVWERMEINELRKLEEVLSVEAEVLKWQERADGANTLERLQEVKNWWMESEVRLPEEQIKKITEILEAKGAELEKQKTYKYYSIHRPVSIGTYPKQGLVSFENYDNQKQIDGIGRTAWAELTYNRALTENEMKEYEFMEEPGQKQEQEKESVDQSSHREVTISAHSEDKTKSKQDLLIEQLHEGIQNMMNSEQYKNWLDTSSRLFSNNYSINNAILVFMQKQDASYTMGYEQWKEYGRNVKQGAKGIKILIPVMAYEKNQGALFKMIKNNLNSQLAKNSSLNVASYRIGKTSLEFTMNREETWGMKVNGKENGIFNNEQEVQKFIQKSILGKVPMYYSVGTVFDVKDTMIPETLWLKEGKFKKEELALAGDGKPRKNRKGEYEVVNTPERRAKFKPSLDMDIPQLNEKKMEQFFGVLKQVSENHNIPVTEVERESDETLKGGADGYFSRKTSDEYPNGYIRLPNDLDPTRKCAVMIHEMAHSRMHSDLEKLNEKFGENVGRSMRETQAESVAYVVGKSFGFETDSSSFQYIAAWSKGLELQEFQKSLNYINKEAKSLIQEIEKEIEDRGLNLEIHVNHEQDSLTQEDILKNGEEQAKGYIERALKEQDNILLMYDKVSEISEGDKQNPNMEALKNNVERQLENIDTILSEAEKMGEVRTKEEQDVCVQKIESAFQRIGQEQEQFQTLKDVGDLSTKFLNNPQKILDELSKDYEEVKKLTRVQKKYLERSPYVAEKLVPLLDENPRAFVDAVMERANMIASVSAKNGMFVEIEYCEQWTETPIFQKGTLAHPKVANMIVKEGEKQMEKLSKTAESKGEYFPYSKCKMIVFTPNKRTLEHQTLKVDIGDGSQKSLTDHMEQVYGKRQANFVKEFVSATRELKAKEKIYIPEKKIQTEKNQTEFEKPKPKEKPNFSLTAIEQGLEQTLEQIQKEKEAKQKEKGGTEKDSQEQTHDSDSNERC